MKNKKKKFILILFIILIMSFGITYAFFTYNRVSDENNTLVAGDIYMNVVDVSNSITLTNQYPMTPSEARSRNDNYIDFNVTGKNTSGDTIYYEIGLDYADDIDGKIRMHDGDLSFDLIDLSNNSYLIKEASYGDLKKAVLYTSSIGTTNNYSRSFRLRMWINDSVIISDTEPNAHYRASHDWDTYSVVYSDTYANVKVKVYGDMVEKSSLTNLYDTLNNSAVMDNIRSTYADSSTGIDYNTGGSIINGQGLYKLNSTSSNEYPINFYRGNVDNNNIVFGNKCWRIVRTTETGGTKLIYNGEPTGYNYTYLPNSSKTYMHSGSSTNSQYLSSSNTTIDLPGPGFYLVVLKITGKFINGVILLGDNFASNRMEFSNESGTSYINRIWEYDGYTGGYFYGYLYPNSSISVLVYRMDNSDGLSCLPYNTNNYIDYMDGSLKGMNDFPTTNHYINSNYYMYNKYEKGIVNSNLFNDETYVSSLNYNKKNYLYSQDGGVSTPSITNKYFMDPSKSTNVNAYTLIGYNNSSKYSIVLNRNEDFNNYLNSISKNINNSYVKDNIDDWFNTYMYNYADMLEDTVFCNDRSLELVNTSGTDFFPKSITQSNVDSGIVDLSCPNDNDKFTVSKNNGNGDLSVPVGLIDATEALLSGVKGNKYESYLLSSNVPITMTTYYSGAYSYFQFGGYYDKGITRPVVSLKHDTLIYGGDGTYNNPYIVK